MQSQSSILNYESAKVPAATNEDLMNIMKGNKGTLAQRLANAFIEKAAEKIDNEMTC